MGKKDYAILEEKTIKQMEEAKAKPDAFKETALEAFERVVEETAIKGTEELPDELSPLTPEIEEDLAKQEKELLDLEAKPTVKKQAKK